MLEDAGHRIVVIVDRDRERVSVIPDVPLVRPEDVESWIAGVPDPLAYVLAIGGTSGRDRLDLAARLTGLGLSALTLVHENAWVDRSASLGEGTQVCGMAAVGVDVSIGRECIVNTNASIDHGSVLGDGVHVMPGATIAGQVTIDDGVTIGSNATVLPFLTIEADAVVGAGAVVTRSVRRGDTVVGTPARPVRS